MNDELSNYQCMFNIAVRKQAMIERNIQGAPEKIVSLGRESI